jgi:hypothetical protein
VQRTEIDPVGEVGIGLGRRLSRTFGVEGEESM